MGTDTDRLAGIDELYAQVAALTSHAQELLADPNRAADAKAEYAAVGFTTVADVLPAAAWTDLVSMVLPYLSRVCEEVTMRHEPLSKERLSDGARLRRLDPHCVHSPPTRAAMTLLLERLGLLALGETIAIRLTPLVRAIAGSVSFRRTYFYLYFEGDYITAHNDHQVGDRVDVQFPVSFSTPGGLRILEDGFLRMRYDRSGSMNVLGPRVWHEVPPLLRADPDAPPQRFNMGFRFTPDDGA